MANCTPNGLARTGLSGIRQILSDELRPYPGRTETVIRMVAACTITTFIVMTFRIPYAFLGIFNAFVISRQKPRWLVRNGLAAVAASAAAVVYTAAGVQLFYDYAVLHFAFLVFTLYLVFYLKGALSNDSITFGFGVTATVALTLIWDLPHPAEAHMASTFSLSFVVMLGTLVAMAVAWVGLQLGRTEDAPPPPIRCTTSRHGRLFKSGAYDIRPKGLSSRIALLRSGFQRGLAGDYGRLRRDMHCISAAFVHRRRHAQRKVVRRCYGADSGRSCVGVRFARATASVRGLHNRLPIAIRRHCRLCRLDGDIESAAFLRRHDGGYGLLFPNGPGICAEPAPRAQRRFYD